MEKFRIIIEELVVQEFEVMAENKENAMNIAEEKYHNCEFVLDNGEVQFRQMAVSSPYTEECDWREF